MSNSQHKIILAKDEKQLDMAIGERSKIFNSYNDAASEVKQGIQKSGGSRSLTDINDPALDSIKIEDKPYISTKELVVRDKEDQVLNPKVKKSKNTQQKTVPVQRMQNYDSMNKVLSSVYKDKKRNIDQPYTTNEMLVSIEKGDISLDNSMSEVEMLAAGQKRQDSAELIAIEINSSKPQSLHTTDKKPAGPASGKKDNLGKSNLIQNQSLASYQFNKKTQQHRSLLTGSKFKSESGSIRDGAGRDGTIS